MSHDFDQASLLRLESDLKRPKRQRLDSTVAPDQHAHPAVLYPPKSPVDAVGGYMVSTYATQIFTDTKQLEIYYAWHQAGSPHNYVCYECRKPYNLICCKTCCRAYHVDCLSFKPAESSPQNPAAQELEWHCDACKRRKWDINPPLSHELTSHPDLHPSQNSRSHSWAATSNRVEAPSRKLQSFSEGHYPERGSKLRHLSNTSAEDIFDIPHSHPFVARPREPSRISEGDEAAADESETSEQLITLPFHGRTTHTLVLQRESRDDIVEEMQAEIEALREKLGEKDTEVREIEELRKENAMLKSKIESLEAASAKEGESTIGKSSIT